MDFDDAALWLAAVDEYTADGGDMEPFKISIPLPELEQLDLKLRSTRLPGRLGTASWTEASRNGINLPLLKDIFTYWKTEYSWPEEEARLNTLPHFRTSIDVEDFDSQPTHFIHGLSKQSKHIPLLFLHGWPGSFIEISKGLDLLTDAGFDVVAPSHAGFTFSPYPDRQGFKLAQYAEVAHNLMLKLGYSQYFVQGGDWGAHIGRVLSMRYPDHVLGLHLNNIGGMAKEPDLVKRPKYTDFEKHQIAANHEFNVNGHAYADLQHSTPLALGLALHDSPMGLLTYMLEKLLSWSDSYPRNPKGYRWTPKEIITWTSLHYFSESGPAGGFAIYREFEPKDLQGFVKVKTGITAFKAEAEMVPRSWAETVCNVVWYKERHLGGHFAMYEQPEALVADIIEFVDMVMKG